MWAINLYESYDVPQRPRTGRQRTDYGYTSTPHIYQDRIIVEVGATQGTVIAFDKRTGVLRWSSEHKEPAGHSWSCVRLTMNGLDGIGVLTLYSFLVMRIGQGLRGSHRCHNAVANRFRLQHSHAGRHREPNFDYHRL